MPDITMCLSEICNKKEQCWRYVAPPYTFQSYCNFDFMCNQENNYLMLLEIPEQYNKIKQENNT
jgi:hypothetical protein